MVEGGLGLITRHPEYYLSDGSVTFSTSGTLFKVHRSFFARDSRIFADYFEEDPRAGTTDANAFKLEVTPEEFSHLLWVWYNRDYTYARQPKAKWIDILRLATRWEFDNIKDLAIRELEALELPPAERISIYKQSGIDGEHLFPSYVELCKSPTVPTEADARLLQMETLINILQAREGAQRQAGKMGHESPTSACLEDDALRKILSKFFKKGLNPPSSGTSTGQGDQAPDLNEQTQRTRESTSTIIVGDPQIPSKRAQTIERTTQLVFRKSLGWKRLISCTTGRYLSDEPCWKGGPREGLGEDRRPGQEDENDGEEQGRTDDPGAAEIQEGDGSEADETRRGEEGKGEDKPEMVEKLSLGQGIRSPSASLSTSQVIDLVYSFIACVVVAAVTRA